MLMRRKNKTPTPVSVDNKIEETLADFSRVISEAKSHYDDLVMVKQELEDKTQLIEDMIYNAGGYIWQKDEQGRYVYCDPKFCQDMYQFIPDNSRCIDLFGLTAEDAISLYEKRHNKEHGWKHIVRISENYTIEKGSRTRFIECSQIDGKPKILEVVNTPLFKDDGTYYGIVGFAWDRSEENHDIMRYLTNLCREDRAKKIAPGVFVLFDGAASFKTTQCEEVLMAGCLPKVVCSASKPVSNVSTFLCKFIQAYLGSNNWHEALNHTLPSFIHELGRAGIFVSLLNFDKFVVDWEWCADPDSIILKNTISATTIKEEYEHGFMAPDFISQLVSFKDTSHATGFIAPIIKNDELQGILGVYDKNFSKKWSSIEKSLFMLIGSYISDALTDKMLSVF